MKHGLTHCQEFADIVGIEHIILTVSYISIKVTPSILSISLAASFLNQLFIFRKRRPSTSSHPIIRVLHHKVYSFVACSQVVLCIEIAYMGWHVASAGLERCLCKPTCVNSFTCASNVFSLKIYCRFL